MKNITKEKIVVRMAVSPDQAWSVAGPTPRPQQVRLRTPLSDAMKAGRWNPEAEDAQKALVDAFKKEHNMK